MKYCTQCGTQNQDGAKFCASCGRPLEANGIQPTGEDALWANDSFSDRRQMSSEEKLASRRQSALASLQEEMDAMAPVAHQWDIVFGAIEEISEDRSEHYRNMRICGGVGGFIGSWIIGSMAQNELVSFLFNPEMWAIILAVAPAAIDQRSTEKKLDGYREQANAALGKIAKCYGEAKQSGKLMPVGIGRANPGFLHSALAVLADGRASSVEQAINVVIRDNQMAQIVERSNEISEYARQAAQNSRAAAIASGASAVGVGIADLALWL